MKSSNLLESAPEKKLFDPEVLDRTAIALLLLGMMPPQEAVKIRLHLMRDPCFQGSGLVNLTRATQSV